MQSINDVVRGMDIIVSKRREDTRFQGDVIYREDISLWIDDVIGDKGDLIALTDDNILALIDDNAFIIRESKSIYQGEEQLSYSTQELTLKGVSYFAKQIVTFEEPQQEALNSYYNAVLSLQYGIDVDAQELGGIAELNTMYDRYILHTKLETGEFWFTFELFEGFFLLTKITHKVRQVPVKLKGVKVPIL